MEILHIFIVATIGSGDGGAWPPHFYGTRKDRDTLIEQSQYSEKQYSKLLSCACVVINKEIELVEGSYCPQVIIFFSGLELS